MSLVLALEPDPKQAAILRQVVRDRVGADFVLADSKDGAIAAIAERVPDVILVTALLSPRDEMELTDQLRQLDGAEHLQTLTIPLLASGAVEPAKKKRGLLSALTGESSKPAAPIGCDPKVFAEEIRNYLVKAEDAKARATTERSRVAKRSAGAGRKKNASGTMPAARSTKQVVDSLRIPQPAGKPPVVEEKAEPTSGSYWAWDSPTPAEAAAAERPAKAVALDAPDAPRAPEAPNAPDAPRAPHAPHAPSAPDVPVFSSWSNPWDVSKSPASVQSRSEETATAEPQRDPLVYLDDHQLPADALVPSAQEEAVEQLLGQPTTLSAAEMIEAAAPVAPVAPVAPAAPVAPDDEIDLSSLLDGAPTLTVEGDADSDASSDVFAISKDFDLSALLAQALETPNARAESGGGQQNDGTEAARAADAQALMDLKADVDRLRADREEVERALAEARAAQERAEHAAAEVSSKAQEDLERQTREVAERAKEEVAAERRSREQTERELREEAERRLEVERLARAEAERLAQEVESRMREEAEAERRLRAEAERHVAEAHAARAREVAERRQHEQAERQAREQAEQQADAERRAREQAEARADAERQAREAAEQKNTEQAAQFAREADERMSRERLAREQAEARAELERLAREEAEQKIRDEAARLAQEAEQRYKGEAARLAQEAEEKYKGEAARLAREVEQRAAAERQAREQAEARAEAERKSREEAERRAAIEAEAREAAEQRAREDFERRDREIAERVAREAAEREAQQEAERVARELADKAAREEAERRVAEERKARQEAERLARREAERRADAERRAKEEAERLAAEAAIKAREEARAERKARELAERRATEERRARELAERKAREETARRAAAELRAKKEAEERDRERARRATAKRPVIIKKAGKKRAEPAPVATKSKAKEPRPTQDEWGLYDPDKCGMGALFAKLEEIEEGAEVDERSAADDLNDDDASYRAPVVERNPRPLSMWAWRSAPCAPSAPYAPNAPVPPDDFRALVDRLTIPAAVAAVRYASGARIGRVKITRRRRRARATSGEARVIILSRKLLVAARQESAPTGRLTARR